MNYLLVLPVPFHRLDDKTIVCESAFAEHLRLLRRTAAKNFDKLVIMAPQMPLTFYQENTKNLGHLKEHVEGIQLVSMQPTHIGLIKFWALWSVRIFYRLFKEVRRAHIIHAGPSVPVTIPIEFFAIFFGVLFKRKTLFIVDIDERASAKMAYKTGLLSSKSYFLRKFIYDPLVNAQISFAARFCSLSLLKSSALVRDFGRGRPSVKNFLDTAYPQDLVLNDEAVREKKNQLMNSSTLELVYFGRLVSYKGIDHLIKAVAIARQDHNARVHLTIIGSGDQREYLEQVVKVHNIIDSVTFVEALPYGPQLFQHLSTKYLLLAAPLTEDTPRSVFDAMALGLPTLSYDTYYYQDLTNTGAVDTVPWFDINSMGERIAEYAKNKDQIENMIDSAIQFASQNSQEKWMNKRLEWMKLYLGV